MREYSFLDSTVLQDGFGKMEAVEIDFGYVEHHNLFLDEKPQEYQ